jgi:hypothetical protein
MGQWVAIPLEDLNPERDNKPYFTGSQELIIAEITEARGKWIHEFYELPSEEQAKYLAHYEIRAEMQKQYKKEAEKEAKEREKELETKSRRK